ncbi:HIT family protein [Reyranella sp. CPCC 100927]|uniref:HIT family protein n=1 Tax=Reyranella sp. CPCC 100927 TaxID=2599616 RepID=UPI0011B50A62|nr:HIT family protein [Reyranella sp. CPCC 100927]TWS96842.1 HIT family protein [Reyranella sp. CPCC 100927]
MATPNATMTKFGYPSGLVAETAYWSVQVRPAQATLGALVLVCKDPVTAFSDISPQAHAEMKVLVERIERCLKKAFTYDKINWLMLMMVDPDVHFHVLPRYATARTFGDLEFTDPGWPAAPNIGFNPPLGPTTLADLTAHLKRVWADVG